MNKAKPPVPWKLLSFVAAHVPLAVLMRQNSGIAVVHASATMAVAFGAALFGRGLQWPIYSAAYVVGCEVLWRTTRASSVIFWESGKYATAALLGIAFLRHIKKPKDMFLPILYLALLLPSIMVTVSDMGLSRETRNMISFNISGPVALAVCAVFFSQVRMQWDDLHKLLWIFLGPVVGTAAIGTYRMMTAEEFVFTGKSSFTASGGFGPNQVSAVLSLGLVFCLFIAWQERSKITRAVALGLALWLAGQTLLTFSRGGIYNAGICVVLASLHVIPQRRKRMMFLALLGIGYLAMTKFLIPRLDAFTEGMLSERLSATAITGRYEMAEAEIRTFLENPVLGVGPGLASTRHPGYMEELPAHTEFTRLLAEHGLGGVLALVCLLAMLMRGYLRAPNLPARVFSSMMAGWAIVEMGHAATRIAAISLTAGLALLRWDESPAPAPTGAGARTAPSSPKA
ncbi:MAG: O-antigen ligase family protein [Elusimicrobia bacterium]|nr:O-antigen ligase family protein [Elusimicrobiota bacterium]